jgi:hypothetical protein
VTVPSDGLFHGSWKVGFYSSPVSSRCVNFVQASLGLDCGSAEYNLIGVASGRFTQATGRPHIMRKFLIIFAAVAGLIVAVDGSLIEPYRIEVTHSSVQASLTRPLKIAHLSDLHTSGLGRRERKLLLLLDAEHPDVIVITGDTVTWGHRYANIRPLLSRLNAPLGVWLVRGNWENNYSLQVRRARPATSRDEISQTRCLAWFPNYSSKSSSLASEFFRGRLDIRCAAAFFIARKLRAS